MGNVFSYTAVSGDVSGGVSGITCYVGERRMMALFLPEADVVQEYGPGRGAVEAEVNGR